LKSRRLDISQSVANPLSETEFTYLDNSVKKADITKYEALSSGKKSQIVSIQEEEKSGIEVREFKVNELQREESAI
jgi:hypothetical protein